MKRVIYIISLSIILLSIGCFRQVDKNLLIGVYTLNTDPLDSIYIYKNSSYLHRFRNAKGQIYECKGKWSYNGRSIDFDDFIFYNSSGPSTGQGLWSSKVIDENGEIRLNYSSENNIYYKKN